MNPEAMPAQESEIFEWYYSIEDAALYKGVSYHTISRHVRKNELQHVRIGNRALISKTALDAWSPMRQRRPSAFRGYRSPSPAAMPTVIGWLRNEKEKNTPVE